MESFTPEELRTFLRYIIDEITFDYQTKVTKISGHIPLSKGEILYDFAGVWKPAKSHNKLSFELTVQI